MLRSEWNHLKKVIEACLLDEAHIFPYPNISDSLSAFSFNKGDILYLKYFDPDYADGHIISIQIGPFANQEQAKMNQCLDRVMENLEKNGYRVHEKPFGWIENGKAIWNIQFTRTDKASLHLADEDIG